MFLDYQFIEHIEWYKRSSLYPKAIILKPHPANGNRYKIEFSSYEQSVGLRWGYLTPLECG